MTFILYTCISLLTAGLLEIACKIKKKLLRSSLALFAIIIPSLLAGVRGPSVGSDTGMYIQEYISPGSFLFGTGFTRTFEIGFRILRNIIFSLGLPYQVYFFIIQAATLSFLFAAAYSEKNEINIRVTMFIYMFDAYFQSFNMMRQALAVAIVIYAYTQIEKNRNIRGILFILLAGCFHKTAFVFISIVIVKYMLKSKHAKAFITIGILGIIYLLTNNSLLQRIAIIILGEKAIWYTTLSDTGSKLWVYLLKITPIVVLLLLCIKNCYKNNRKFVFYSGLALAGYVLASYGNYVATDAQRMALYLSRVDAIVLGYVVSKPLCISRKHYVKGKDIKHLIYIYWMVMYIYNYFYLGVSKIIPYTLS